MNGGESDEECFGGKALDHSIPNISHYFTPLLKGMVLGRVVKYTTNLSKIGHYTNGEVSLSRM